MSVLHLFENRYIPNNYQLIEGKLNQLMCFKLEIAYSPLPITHRLLPIAFERIWKPHLNVEQLINPSGV